MSYRVIYEFADAQDNCYVYRVGDKFPRPNTQVSEDRIKALASENNAVHKPLIAPIESEELKTETGRTVEPQGKKQRKQK